MKQLYAILFVVSGSACMSACSSQDDDLSDVPVDQNSTLIWQSCSDQSLLQCTTLDVLADPTDTQSGTISLELNRLPSIQKEREGIVLINRKRQQIPVS